MQSLYAATENQDTEGGEPIIFDKKDAKVSWEFITAGRAIFTVEPSAEFLTKEPEAKSHYTYRVNRSRDGQVWFVQAMLGSDNERDYQYIGMLQDNGAIRWTAKSRVKSDSLRFKIADRVLQAIRQGRQSEVESKGWIIHHEGRCGKCGRLLTHPESITTGIGPVCAGR